MSPAVFLIVDLAYCHAEAYAIKWDLPSEAALQHHYLGWWRAAWDW